MSFAFAVAPFTWGAAQPVAGALADRYGPARVLAVGAIVLAIDHATTTLAHSSSGLVLTVGILAAGGSFGQFIFAPITQAIITTASWMSVMWFMAFAALAITPLALLLKTPATEADERGKAVLRKQVRRGQLAEFFVNLPPCLIGMEARTTGDERWNAWATRCG